MLNNRNYFAWGLRIFRPEPTPPDHYHSEVERRFFETVKHPPPPSPELVAIGREYAKRHPPK